VRKDWEYPRTRRFEAIVPKGGPNSSLPAQASVSQIEYFRILPPSSCASHRVQSSIYLNYFPRIKYSVLFVTVHYIMRCKSYSGNTVGLLRPTPRNKITFPWFFYPSTEFFISLHVFFAFFWHFTRSVRVHPLPLL